MRPKADFGRSDRELRGDNDLGFLTKLFQDWKANAGNPKIQLVLASFRLSQAISRAPRPLFYLGLPYLVLYRVTVEWLLAIELHWSLEIGPGLCIHHGYGLVVNPRTVIGANCTLRHATTFGAREATPGKNSGLPTLGDGVNIGPHCVILGPVRIGNEATIGAGSVVVRDVPEGAVAVGNPARILGSAADPAAEASTS